MRISVRRPSPALVISCIALTVALGGTSFAAALALPRNSVGTTQLKNSAVTSAKVRNRSLLRVDFASGQLPAGPAGAQGPTGPTGPTGASGAPGLSGMERVDTTSVSNSLSTKTQATTCPSGKRLLGGGVRLNPLIAQLGVQQAYPDNDNVFRATVREVTATATNWSITVFAVCANAS
jgi:hypothetical protein